MDSVAEVFQKCNQLFCNLCHYIEIQFREYGNVLRLVHFFQLCIIFGIIGSQFCEVLFDLMKRVKLKDWMLGELIFSEF